MRHLALILSSFFFLSFYSYGQKSYIKINCNHSTGVSYTGDLPAGFDAYKYVNWTQVIYAINELAQSGYVIEHTMCYDVESSGKVAPTEVYIMSKNAVSTSDFETVPSESDTESYEVARYNLQGIPVNPSEKGVQIIVYSNYTTKTIIVE